MHRRLILSTLVLSALAALAPAAFAADTHAASLNPDATKLVTTELPRVARPLHYDIALVPDAANARFTGKVAITLDVLTATPSITLNADNLSFRSALISAARGKGTAQSADVSVNADRRTATFSFKQPLAKGRYRFVLDYSGIIGKQSTGLFSLDYETPAGHKRALYTQFEDSDARRMIPCWDEPAYKATFTLEATVPANDMAVSNMPAVKTTALPDGRNLVAFGTTPKMSSYLLFFGMGEFDRATTSAEGVELGVVMQKGLSSQAQFALTSASSILHEYNDYFGVRYPLPKLDNIAGPGRGNFGAMENWGSIFTFENNMLLDPAISTESDKERVFAVEAHEMAHQWFGDLVTMNWWDDLWLNEGFASWMEERTTARVHPEWNTKLAAVNIAQSAMNRDSLSTTHPVIQHAATVEQEQTDGAIIYNKGQTVIRMLESYVGADAWRDGVRAYMKQHAYGNTESDDLWRAVEKATGKPIMAIAHDFTLQPGVPLIHVGDPVCSAGKTSVTLIQGEFSRDQPNKVPLSWHVPVLAQVQGSGTVVSGLVENGHATLTLSGCGAVVVNAGQYGYFATLYSPRAFAAITAEFPKLASIDQLGVLSDSWSLGMAGLQSMADVFTLAQALPADADPQVWSKVVNVFGAVDSYYRSGAAQMADEAAQQRRFRQFALARLTPLMAKIGWDARANETHAIVNLRAELIATLSRLDDSATIAEARRRYAASTTNPAALPSELRQTVMNVVALHADAATWDGLRAAARGEKSPMIKDQLYDLLAVSEDEALAQRALDLAMSDEVSVTNGAGMISRIALRHPDLAFNFALAHGSVLNERIAGGKTARGPYYSRLASSSVEPATMEKLKKYAADNVPPEMRRAVDTAIATMQYRIKVRAERLPAIDAFVASSTSALSASR